jgi:hypothetical protein
MQHADLGEALADAIMSCAWLHRRVTTQAAALVETPGSPAWVQASMHALGRQMGTPTPAKYAEATDTIVVRSAFITRRHPV